MKFTRILHKIYRDQNEITDFFCMISPVRSVKEEERIARKQERKMPKKKEPTYVEDSARDPEDAWIFDSLVGFLRGPVWHVPVMSFIEQKSLSEYL